MYAAGREHPYKEPCLSVLSRIFEGDLEAYSSIEVVQEMLYRYSALGERARGIDLCHQVVLLLPLIPLGVEVAALSLKLSRSYPRLSSRDAIHAAVAASHGLTAIISADRHFDDVAEVRRVDPADIAA